MIAGALAASDLNSESCATAPRLPLPPVGLSMELRFSWGDDIGSGSEIITAVEAPGATFVQSIDIQDGGRRAMPPESRVLGLFPVKSEFSGRSKHYAIDPAAALAGLRVGQTTAVAFGETLALNGKTHKRNSAAKVTFLGCSRMDVAGVMEPVVNFRVVVDSFIVSKTDKKVRVAQTDSVYSISQTYGWRIREQVSDGGLLEATKISLK
ncbi:MAG: hypothetical protein HXY23_10805 [Parvularculaceae bacterium]|nr:hypothetical protein [Parvularculaceae bacterium]